MSPDFAQAFPGADAFGAFWTDFMRRMAAGGAAGVMPTPGPEALNQARRAFFDALSEHADKFMRSEAFLQSMRQAMEQSLAMQQAMNDFVKKGLSAAQMPSRDDADHITLLIRGVEDRLMDRLERLGRRLERLESGGQSADGRRPSTRPQPAAERGARKRVKAGRRAGK